MNRFATTRIRWRQTGLLRNESHAVHTSGVATEAEALRVLQSGVKAIQIASKEITRDPVVSGTLSSWVLACHCRIGAAR